MTPSSELSNATAGAAPGGARILLSYVSYPITTAAYMERALRTMHQVVTCGPTLDRGIVSVWRLENMKVPIRDLDIPVGNKPDLGAMLDRLDPRMYPDMLLWIESVPGFIPTGLDRLRCPKACYLIDSHIHLNEHLAWAQNFDKVFIAQRQYLDDFRRAGMKDVYWLPLGADVDVHRKGFAPKRHDVGFVGSLGNPRRTALLKKLQAAMPIAMERVFWTEMADFLSSCKVVFNSAINNDLNMRVFEVLSTGSFLLTDQTFGNGQEEMFIPGEDLGVYDDATLVDSVRSYLQNEGLREHIAATGQRRVHAAHTYRHRAEELVHVVLGGAKDTPSPEEWRARSLAGVIPEAKPERAPTVTTRRTERSFVIPVLDMSPASPYNIEGLLRDLQSIDGTVIVVFNSSEMAQRFAGHPRIDRSAIMSQNVGVSRAWNIGRAMADTPTVFFLNADLHVEGEIFDLLERGLRELPDAAVVGPQGSFFHFPSAHDLMYFDKGTCSAPLEVDAVSGFLFGINRDLFARRGIWFDDRYTPCYFEEWDTGLQLRSAGLRSYVVPATSYAHEWSGSIRALRMIRYMGREETSHEIHVRNQALFLEKWKTFAGGDMNAAFLESKWVDFLLATMDVPGQAVTRKDRERIIQEILRYYPESAKAHDALHRLEMQTPAGFRAVSLRGV